MKGLWNEYLKWLIQYCKLERKRDYYKAFETLHDIPFIFFMERDINRRNDAFVLRQKYPLPKKYDDLRSNFMYRETSVFEVLCALAIRTDSELIGESEEGHPEYFMIEMLDNLNASKCSEEELIYKISRWLRRTGKRNGKDTPFPVKSQNINQKKREIWDQMNAYIHETYYVGKYERR